MKAHARWRRLLGWLLVAGLTCSLWAASLVICPKCGWETDSSAQSCPHCGAPLPVVKVETAAPAVASAPAAAVPQSSVAISDRALNAARADRSQADNCLSNGRPEVAYAYYENALALSRLVRREGLPPMAGQSLVEGRDRALRAVEFTTHICPACGGSGARTVRVQTLAGDKSPVASLAIPFSDGLVCLTCGGRGSVTTSRLAGERRVLIAQGNREFEVREQADGLVACGRVWMPAALLALLDVKAQALVRTARPTPCPGCMGLGQQDCSRCKGAGRVKCTGDGCVNGQITVKDANPLAANNNVKALTHKEVCPVCQGSGLMACPDCLGRGTVPCKNCNGTGRSPACSECGGQGWETCSKCQGSGMTGKTVCPVCHGEKVMLCPKCHGEGCSAR